MKHTFAVGVLSHSCVSNLRFELLDQTLRSLIIAFEPVEPVVVIDNGSKDGSTDVVAELVKNTMPHWQRRMPVHRLVQFALRSFIRYMPPDGNHSPGRGRNVLVEHIVREFDPEYIVLSDDDMLWNADARNHLFRFMHNAPKDIAIVSGLLEPEWDWNTPRGLVEAGGEKALWRDSAPGAAWCLRAEDWGTIGPLNESPTGSEDFDACVKLRSKGLRVAQMDLAKHLGEKVSTLNNTAGPGRPLNRKKWGLE